MRLENSAAVTSLAKLRDLGLLNPHEFDVVAGFGAPGSRFRKAVELAETLHLHIKVEDTNQLPINAFFQAGAELDHQKNGFVKYRFPGAINAIFSHIKVSQDELLETPETRRPRPFLDHLGIDLRDETQEVPAPNFKALPRVARKWGIHWHRRVGRASPFCCHVEVAEKHWLYPPESGGHPAIPLEFAYGGYKVNPDKSGCDLRPADPTKVDPASVPSCCGTTREARGTRRRQHQSMGSREVIIGPRTWADLAKSGARIRPSRRRFSLLRQGDGRRPADETGEVPDRIGSGARTQVPVLHRFDFQFLARFGAVRSGDDGGSSGGRSHLRWSDPGP